MQELVSMAHRVGRPAVGIFPPGAVMPSRVLDDHELVWMLHGRARLTGDQPIDLGPGDVLLIPPGLRHGIDWLGGAGRAPTRHGYLHFDGDAVATRLPDRAIRVPATSDDPLLGLAAYLLWLGSGAEDWQRRVRPTLDFLLSTLVDGPLPGETGAGELPAPVTAALRWLGAEWATPPLRLVRPAELAAAGHVSTAHLNRLFAAAFGLGPAAVVARLRCARAESLLLHTDLPLAAIARECGYADAAHLSHRFGALTGAAPRVYRTGRLAVSVLDASRLRRAAHLLVPD